MANFSILNKITDVTLKNSINNIINKSKKIHNTPFLYTFTDHGIEHSERMLRCINEFLTVCNKKNLLNEYECYVLVSSIYLHDIGIQESKKDVLYKFSKTVNLIFNDKIDIPKFVRDNHHLISSYLIKEDFKKNKQALVFDGDQKLGEYICYVVESHGIDFSQKDDIYKNYIYRDKTIRVKLLSVLLCLADSFDCDIRRIDPNRFQYVELPEISRIHWIKHLYVNGIKFGKHLITISYTFPDTVDSEKESYKKFFCLETEYWITDIKNKYLMLLDEYDIVFEINREISYSSYLEKLSNSDYSYIEERILDNVIASEEFARYKIVSIGVLRYKNNILMVRRRNPETSLAKNDENSILEWQFPAGIVKTIDNAKDAIKREVLEETGINCTVGDIIGKRIHPNTFTICYYYSLIYKEGKISNGDVNENISVEWISLKDYKSKITSNIYWKVEEYLNKEKQ